MLALLEAESSAGAVLLDVALLQISEVVMSGHPKLKSPRFSTELELPPTGVL